MTRENIRRLYGKRARRYDQALWLLRMAGVRDRKYRREAVDRLHLRRGDTAVDLG